ncbi:hypothetical protein LDJ99_01010 [Fusobacterium nucleatum]|uniref:alginate O-acetyltransferase AlgX-related protein n=1 Tax=Fusobacterium nucleatum TaxID=851 RepID=UPI0030D55D9B
MKQLKKIFIVFFMILLFLPLIFFNWEDDYVSLIDNRVLKKFPNKENLAGGDITDYIQSYINDRIGGRERIINLYTELNDKVFNLLVHPTYTYGKDGYIFFKMKRNIEYEEYHRKFAETIKKIQTYCEERGVPFYFVFSPEKEYVYSEYLPKGVNYNREWVDRFIEDLKELGVNFIDNSDFLKEKAKEEFVFNKKYDAGHWNDLGAFLGMNNVYEKIHQKNPNLLILSENYYDKLSKVEESLPVSYFKINEEVPNWELKVNYENITEQYINEVKRNNLFGYFGYYKNLSQEAENSLKLLIFHGSYLNSRWKFVIPTVKEYIGIHNYQNILDIPYYFNIFKPDLVIFEVAEYTITDHYFSAKKMSQLDFPPFLDEYKKGQAKMIPDIDILNYDIKFNIEEGNKITKLTLSGLPGNAKYVYLSIKGEIYDFMKIDDSIYELSLLKEVLEENQKYEIFYTTDKGEIYRF